jgi:hypothetical protein
MPAVPWESTIFLVVGSLVAGVISWWVTKRYYVKASEDLRQAASALKQETLEVGRLSTLILKSLEEGEVVELNRDENRKIIGIVIHGTFK